MRDIFIGGLKVLGIYFIYQIIHQIIYIIQIIDSFEGFELLPFIRYTGILSIVVDLIVAYIFILKSSYIADKLKIQNTIDINIPINERNILKLGIILIGIFYTYSIIFTLITVLTSGNVIIDLYNYLWVIKFIIKLWLALLPVYFIFRADRVADFILRK